MTGQAPRRLELVDPEVVLRAIVELLDAGGELAAAGKSADRVRRWSKAAREVRAQLGLVRS